MNIRIYRNDILNVLLCEKTIEKDNVRQMLRFIHIEGKNETFDAISTDGYQMLHMRGIYSDADPAKGYISFNFTPFKCPKKVLYVEFSDEEEKGILQIKIVEKNGIQILRQEIVEGDYIRWTQVVTPVQSRDHQFRIAVNANYLRNILEAFKDEEKVILNFGSMTEPIFITAMSSEDRESKTGIVLPVRLME